METISPNPKRRQEEKVQKEEIADRVKNRLNELLHSYHTEQVEPLSVEEKHERAKTGTKEDVGRLEKYKLSKFRINWLSAVLSDLRLALDEELLEIPDREELIKEEKNLFNALKTFQKQNSSSVFELKIPPDLIRRGDNLLKKVLEGKNKEKK